MPASGEQTEDGRKTQIGGRREQYTLGLLVHD